MLVILKIRFNGLYSSEFFSKYILKDIRMPKKQIIEEPADNYEIEQEIEEVEEEVIEEPVKISKRTGKPARKLTELQKETLARGRAIAVQKRKDLIVGIDLQKRAELIKKAKEEVKNARDIRQREKIQKQKEMYEEAINDPEIIQQQEKEPIKKVKKKVIKYVSSSDSDSSDGEVIIKKKKSNKKERNENIVDDRAVYNLKNKLLNDRLDEMAKLLMPQ